MNPPRNAKLILISDKANAPYSGMLPLFLKGEYSYDEIHFDLRRICALANVEFIESRVTRIDAHKKLIYMGERPAIEYDLAVINIGITPKKHTIPNSSNIVFIKPISTLIQQFDLFIEKIKKNESAKPIEIALVGGGAAGVEVSLAIKKRLEQLSLDFNISLYQKSDRLLQSQPKRASQLILRKLESAGINVLFDCDVSDFQSGVLKTNSNKSYPADFIFVSTDAKAPDWLGMSGLPVDASGFVQVDESLRVRACDGLFAAGDCIHFANKNLPKAGVYAVREGAVIVHNLRAEIEQKSLEKYIPQKTILALIHCGEKETLFSKYGVVLSGRIFFKLKQYIDEKFMNNFSLPFYKSLPQEMKPIQYLEEKDINTCGGCGSKASPELLYDILHSQAFESYQEVLPAVLDDAPSFATVEGLMSSSIDGFRPFINDPYLFGKISALHALSDLAANGAKPLNANISVTLKIAPKKLQEYELSQTMLGICEVFKKHQVKIIKGHTNEGSESNITISVNGISAKKDYGKNKLRIGDQLILTKSLGSGVLLRGLMLGHSKGEWCTQLIAEMLKDNLDVLPLLNQFDISAMTDVTGFSLIGHLLEMLAQTELAATLSGSQIPVMDGVHQLLEEGIESHLAPKLRSHYEPNIASLSPIKGAVFDPQTNGGLLLGVKKNDALTLLAELKRLGFNNSCIIGEVGTKLNQYSVKYT